jgi:hypothetical protein
MNEPVYSRDLERRMDRSEEDRREMWREQGRMQERLARQEQKTENVEEGQEKLLSKVDGLSKLAWGIMGTLVILLVGVIVNLVILASHGGGP